VNEAEHKYEMFTRTLSLRKYALIVPVEERRKALTKSRLGIIIDMQQDAVIRTLKQKNAELTERFGVKSLQLFGSVARNKATASSDVDLLVEFDRPVGYFGLFALQDYLENILGCPVDLGTPDSLKPRLRERVMGELIRVT
jgi:uncharacterized protein